MRNLVHINKWTRIEELCESSAIQFLELLPSYLSLRDQ